MSLLMIECLSRARIFNLNQYWMDFSRKSSAECLRARAEWECDKFIPRGNWQVGGKKSIHADGDGCPLPRKGRKSEKSKAGTECILQFSQSLEEQDRERRSTILCIVPDHLQNISQIS